MKNEASFVATVNIFICQCTFFNEDMGIVPHKHLSAHCFSHSGDAFTGTGVLLLEKMLWWQNGESTNRLKLMTIKQKKQPQMMLLVCFNQPTPLLLPSQSSSCWTHLWNVALELHWLRMHNTANGCCVFFYGVLKCQAGIWNASFISSVLGRIRMQLGFGKIRLNTHFLYREIKAPPVSY